MTAPSIAPDDAVLLGAAVEAALLGGEEAKDVYRGQFDVERKADDSPITEADRRSQEAILGVLRSRTPEVPVVSEEAAETPYDVRRSWRRHWLVDPLDGTKEFVKRNGEFTVNVALIEGAYPRLGVVLIPVEDLLYVGFPGGALVAEGAGIRAGLGEPRGSGNILELLLRAGRRLGGARTEGVEVRAVVSRSHLDAETRSFLGRIESRGRKVVSVAAGSAKKLCVLAAGEADVYPRFGPTMEWDIAAGQAVLEASGGKVLDASSAERFSYGKASLVNPAFVALASGRDPGYYLDNPLRR